MWMKGFDMDIGLGKWIFTMKYGLIWLDKMG